MAHRETVVIGGHALPTDVPEPAIETPKEAAPITPVIPSDEPTEPGADVQTLKKKR